MAVSPIAAMVMETTEAMEAFPIAAMAITGFPAHLEAMEVMVITAPWAAILEWEAMAEAMAAAAWREPCSIRYSK